MEHVLTVLIVTIAIATFLNVLLKKFDIPTVIGYVLSGFAISTFYHFAEASRVTLSYLAEFGIVFLMFTIGLEFSVSHLKSMKREVFLFGSLQVILSGSLFSLLGFYLFDLSSKIAIVIGFALALSSTAIVLKLLNERNEMHSGYGRVAVGILIFQDLAVIPMLLMVSIFTSTDASLKVMLWDTLISAVLVFAILFFIGKFLLERFFDMMMDTGSEEIFLISVILGVLSASVLAEYFGFSYSLGAFLAGMMLSDTKYRYRIEADLTPFRDILLGIFFVSIGMLIDWHSIYDYWYVILGLLIGIMLLKALVIFVVLRFFVQKRTAFKASLALFEVGEFALAIFELANTKGLLDDRLNQILIITVVLSMIITPFVLKNIKRIADLLAPEPDGLRDRALVGGSYENHVIICGYGPVGRKIVRTLKKHNVLYVILEHDVKVVDDLIAEGEESIFFANAAQKLVLEHFNISQSTAIIVTIDNAIQKRLICENIASFDPYINSIVQVMNHEEEESIAELGITHVINARDMIADIMEEKAKSCVLNIAIEKE